MNMIRVLLSAILFLHQAPIVRPQILAPIVANVQQGGAPFSASDTFTGMDGTTLEMHDACWDVTVGGFYLGGGGTVLVPDTPGPDFAVWTCGTPANDQYSEVTLGGAFGGGVYGTGPTVRYDAGTDTGYACEVKAAGTMYVLERTAGSNAVLNSGAYAPMAGDVIRLSIIGSALSCNVNGTPTVTTTDGTIATGKPGIWAADSAIYLLDAWAAEDE